MLTSIYIGTLGRWVQPQASGSPAPFVLRDVLLTKLDVGQRRGSGQLEGGDHEDHDVALGSGHA